MPPVVDEFLQAARAEDRERMKLLLHPYLHWGRHDGTTLRGRRKVLAMLQEMGVPDRPAAVELRDGQIYRWETI